jgi:hypothetical protein
MSKPRSIAPVKKTAADLQRYEAMCRAIAEAKRADEVIAIHDEARALRAAARVANNREAEADLHVIRRRAEYRLNGMMVAARASGELKSGSGRPRKNGSPSEPFRATLAEAGIDKKLAMRAAEIGALSPAKLEVLLKKEHAEIIGGRPNAGLGIGSSRVHSLDSLDHFPTPPWVTRTLMEVVLPRYGIDPRTLGQVWEPANGDGHMSEVLKEYVEHVDASDIHDYGHQDFIHDFLNGGELGRDVAWIVSNPPFKGRNQDRALEFTLRALDIARCGVAMLVRTQWATETLERYERLLRDRPPTILAFFIERVGFHPERWDPDGVTLNTGISWCAWLRDKSGLLLPTRPPLWIPPGQRKAMTRPDDRERFAAWSMVEEAADRAPCP